MLIFASMGSFLCVAFSMLPLRRFRAVSVSTRWYGIGEITTTFKSLFYYSEFGDLFSVYIFTWKIFRVILLARLGHCLTRQLPAAFCMRTKSKNPLTSKGLTSLKDDLGEQGVPMPSGVSHWRVRFQYR